MKAPKIFFISILTILLTVSVLINGFAMDKGVTGLQAEDEGFSTSYQPAVKGGVTTYPPLHAESYKSPWAKYTDDWNLIDSQTFSVSVPEWMHFAVSFTPAGQVLELHDLNTPLSQTQMDAIERAPSWMRDDLYDNLRRFEYSFVGDVVANEILSAPDPFVDEIAFQAAHIPPVLFSQSIYFELLRENAEYIYTVDSSLNYVEIVDYGDSNDDDYYTTARYKIIDAAGDTVQIEIDKEYYYWYILHPKVSDEIPTYINPETGDPANPPDGVFWRTYFWTHADSGRDYLSDHLTDEEVLWSRESSSGGAMSALNAWIDNNMVYQVQGERPIQPVRIYHLHMGYCGEYQDIRCAAGRTALVPTACTSNNCEDHAWNEFWDEEWIHWDGTINNSLMYENSWGKTLSGVFNFRGDGYCYSATERYSADLCTLAVTLYDSAGKPADGVRVKIRSDAWSGGGLSTAGWVMTDASGQASIVFGDAQDYYIRLDGALGNYPENLTEYILIIDDSEPGELYTWEYTFDNAPPVLEITEAPEYPDPLDDYMMEIEYTVEYERTYAWYLSNWVGNQYIYNEFGTKLNSGFADFFIVNQANYEQYFMSMPAEGFGIAENSSAGDVSFVLPTDDAWYAVFSGREFSTNRPQVTGTVNIYASDASVGDGSANGAPLEFALNNPYPNPFNAESVLEFALPSSGKINLSVYDVTGRKVLTLIDGYKPAGTHSLRFEAEGLTSGVYFVRLDAGEFRQARKICLVK